MITPAILQAMMNISYTDTLIPPLNISQPRLAVVFREVSRQAG